MNEKVLLLGSSFSAMPFLTRLKKRNFDVFVCGKHADDPCHQHADGSFHIDYSDPEAVLSIARQGNFKYVIPSCNDASYFSGAYTASKLGLPGYDSLAVTNILHLKSEFRKFTAEHSVSAPRAIYCSRTTTPAASEIHYPALIKPVDNFSGNGISLVNRAEELSAALERAFLATRHDQVLIEEYVTGSLHSHSAFIKDGAIALDFFVDEFCTVYPYQVNCSNHPSRITKKIREDVRQSMEDIISKLGLADGLLHTQFMQDGEQHWIIECMRRCPGDMYNLLVEESTGIDYSEYYLNGFLQVPSQPCAPTTNRYMARHTISSDKPTGFLSFSCSIPSDKISIVPLKTSGHALEQAPSDKIGILFAEFPDQSTLEETTPHLAALTKILS
ncbi:ATP-grasp domain-containing protein [Pseudomonas sp. ABC1]|uniref:ATP-grasp domain-containing protein n=1 Tax=Pseudomonas sp. ABC1 TaxID=2748080 RepID=UPI0015C37BC9|nr:ATP-grasp domain-containing protein [Pseudomonas sp. ABC1]QLF94160.1 ATP-grasp domain-containing protein [Pseudomonas sp. ABC1]